MNNARLSMVRCGGCRLKTCGADSLDAHNIIGGFMDATARRMSICVRRTTRRTHTQNLVLFSYNIIVRGIYREHGLIDYMRIYGA